MRSSVIWTVAWTAASWTMACGAIVLVALAAEPASAANGWGGNYCMSDREGRADCSFITLAQCQASASGTDAGCYARPGVMQQQGAYLPQAAPVQAQRQRPRY